MLDRISKSIILHDKIAVILSTYNGGLYIEDQLDSIYKQTHENWHIYVRDDGSTDNTLEILNRHAEIDSRITIIKDLKGNLGYNKSVPIILSFINEDYIAFFDQDDVTFPTRLTKSLQKLKEIETENKEPALVHAEAQIVDSKLNLIKKKFIGKHGTKKSINGIIFANCVSGSSMMINTSLKNVLLSTLDNSGFLHLDYHIAIVAELVGHRAFISEPLLNYRQHQNNVIGTIGAHKKQEKLGKYTLSLLAGLSTYPLFKTKYVQIETSIKNKLLLADYFYMYEGESRFKKIWIFLKNRYAFTRKKDLLTFFLLLLKNEDLRKLIK